MLEEELLTGVGVAPSTLMREEAPSTGPINQRLPAHATGWVSRAIVPTVVAPVESTRRSSWLSVPEPPTTYASASIGYTRAEAVRDSGAAFPTSEIVFPVSPSPPILAVSPAAPVVRCSKPSG